jgi:hypothetical protein
MRGGRDPHISLLMALALRYRPPASPSTLGSSCPVPRPPVRGQWREGRRGGRDPHTLLLMVRRAREIQCMLGRRRRSDVR